MKRLVIDTETTGLSAANNKTLTVGMLLVDVEKDFLEILDSNHIFIKHEEYNANPFAMRINKINLTEHHKIGIEPKKACQKINRFITKNSLAKTTLLGHNFGFDQRFLTALFEQGNTKPKLHHEHEDTMKIWKNLQNEGIVPQGSKRLKILAQHFDIDYTKAHDALADCEITAQAYHNILKIYPPSTL